jgi:hypothetical protein
MQISRRAISRFVGILCALLLATLPIAACYDFFSPWPVVAQSLERFGKNYRFCVGISGWSYSSDAGGRMI